MEQRVGDKVLQATSLVNSPLFPVPRRPLVLPGNSFGCLRGDGEGKRQFPVGLYGVMARDTADHFTRHTESPQQRDLALILGTTAYVNVMT